MTQEETLAILKTGGSAFITGAAGSGKTYVLNRYLDYLNQYEVPVAVTASTGIAASHLGGMTIHAWSGLGIRSHLSPYDLEELEEKAYLWKRWERTKVLIIDEISMLHGRQLEMIDTLARFFKRNTEPFGGLQVVLCGDFFQLPPISREKSEESLFSGGEPTTFAYHAQAWHKLNPTLCYLSEQHRQANNDGYLNILQAIRDNQVTAAIREQLASRISQETPKTAEITRLYTHNTNVDRENEAELDRLPGQIFSYEMVGQGRDGLVVALKKSCLAPEILRLKKGARVMFVKNNFEQGYVNGTLGVVSHCDPNTITVKTVNGVLIQVTPAAWQIEEDGKVKAEISQYPLRLAWAITIHKSQGMSLDNALIDLSRSFEPGMGYVALSRLRSLGGLTLRGLNDLALKVHDEVLEKDQLFREQSSTVAADLTRLHPATIKEQQQDFLNRVAPRQTGVKTARGSRGKKEPKMSTLEVTKKMVFDGKSLAEIAVERSLTTGTILEHLEKIKLADPVFPLRYLLSELSVARQKKIRAALQAGGMEGGKYPLTPAKERLGDGFSYEEIRLVRLVM